jgi:phage tail-like protein
MPAPRTIPPSAAPVVARNGAAAASAAAPSRRSPGGITDEADPVTELRFVVALSGVDIGRFKEVSGLSAQVDVKEYAEGGVNHFMHKLPGRIKWGPLTLKRGVTRHDALIRWFWEARTRTRPVAMVVSLRGPGGEVVRSWAFIDAFPVKWTGPNMSAASSQIATETLEIAHSGLTQAA